MSGWVELGGGTFRYGSEAVDAYSEEAPEHVVSVDAFGIAATAVSVAEFGAFVAATGYVTDAERIGRSFVFAGLLADDHPPTRGVVGAAWWREVDGASWSSPEGPGSAARDRLDHPVTHVSWRDASAFAEWADARLPSEIEWEHAARGGLDGQPYPWGNEREPGGVHRMNVWQGSFPDHNTLADGWYGTAPADAYEPNAYGLFNMCGNAWEWTADRFDPDDDRRALRGGSFLCHESYCMRYRTSARVPNHETATMSHTGFRLAH